ncbi:MAG: DUF1015 domain-containing protein [Candidatus Omnitrophota bacterium]
MAKNNRQEKLPIHKMTEIKPFPGIVYNSKQLRQPSKLICPPYDIITPDQAIQYRKQSNYNMVHLTLPQADSGQNRHKKSSRCFKDWLNKGIMLQDREPAIYFYQQEYRINKRKLKRLGFIACLRLKNDSCVYGHEHTHIEPKEDRFKLLVKVQANLEPIFVVFSDPSSFIQKTFKRYARSNKPLMRFRDQEKNINRLWALSAPDILEKLKKEMGNKVLFIADGHHRYEVSLGYQELWRNKLKQRVAPINRRRKGLKDRDFNYIMVYFCPLESQGLIIRPVHRLVKGVTHIPFEDFKKAFNIKITNRADFFATMESKALKQRIVGMYCNKKFHILTLKNNKLLAKIDKDYRCLDISLLNQVILKGLLKIDPNNKERVLFNANGRDLIREVDADNKALAFFLRPAVMGDIMYLAKAGKKLPPKTTYFYPKIPSGLVIYKINNK